MKKKYTITDQQLKQIDRGAIRDQQKADGALDGRFRTKVVIAKKGSYKRNNKHKGYNQDEQTDTISN